MKKLLILFISIILIILVCFILIRNSFLDRFNPLIKMEYSYAKVPKDTQKYEKIKIMMIKVISSITHLPLKGMIQIKFM
ncbi:YxeA family protein [Staphylococcus capitis]|uniref:YxeA family protein n=1 Tax=Staphylococcus capitis TaxID=29388 RepID=UPI00345C5D1B